MASGKARARSARSRRQNSQWVSLARGRRCEMPPLGRRLWNCQPPVRRGKGREDETTDDTDDTDEEGFRIEGRWGGSGDGTNRTNRTNGAGVGFPSLSPYRPSGSEDENEGRGRGRFPMATCHLTSLRHIESPQGGRTEVDSSRQGMGRRRGVSLS